MVYFTRRRALRRLAAAAVPAALSLMIGLACGIGLYAADFEDGVLHWRNGDQLPGRLLGADTNTLRWQSTVFSTPFDIDINALAAIQYPAPTESVKSELPFRLVTVSNDVLLGALVDITNKHLVIDSPRHGTLELDRDQLMGVQRHNRRAAGSVGLGLLTDWTTLHRGRQISEWTRGVDGRIETTVTGAELYRDLHLTTLSEIEVELSWTGKPGFMISFAGPDAARLSKQVVKLETWENDLVLQTLGANGDFEVIQTLSPEKESLALQLRWNPTEGELAVHSSTGQLLGRMKGEPLPASQLSGLYIQNKGAALNLTRLRANGWDGASAELPAGSVRVRLADAKALTGKITAFDGAQRLMELKLESGAAQKVPLDDIDSLDLGNPSMPQLATAPVRVTFLDGTQISGNLQSAQDGVVKVKTGYCAEQISAKLSGVFGVRFAPPENGGEALRQDVINFDQFRLRGELMAVAELDNAVGWRPIGSTNASKLPTGQRLRITRADVPDGNIDPQKRFLDRIFLRNGDAVPCTIHGIDGEHLFVDVPLTKNSRINREMVVAVEFGAFAGSISKSFADAQWVVAPGQKDAVTRSDVAMVVRDTASIGYDNIRDADEIAFDVKWNMLVPTLIRVSFFSDGPTNVGQTPSVMLYRTSGTRVMLQGMQGMGAMGQVRGVAPIQTRDGGNSFRFRIRQKQIVVYENNTELLTLPLDRSRFKGKSLALNVQRLNVNNVQALEANGKKPELVTLQNVSVRRAGGDVLNFMVDGEERDRLLTIPRFRKQAPPTEILVGHNGDLLRGRLISLDENNASFVSRLDEMTVPRERLAGIIWPQTDEAVEETARADAKLARILFVDGSIMRMTAEQIIDDALVGQHPALGPVAIPIPLTRELMMGGGVEMSSTNAFADWVLRPAAEPKFAEMPGNGDGAGAASGFDSPLVGNPAPGFAADLLDGTRFRLAEQKGKVIVLDFWATWCGPCVKSMPHTSSTVAEFPHDQVMLLAVNQLETPDTIREFLETRGWKMDVALDHDGQIGKLFQVAAIPQLVVVDADGIVQRIFVGDRGDLSEQLKQVLLDLTTVETQASD